MDRWHGKRALQPDEQERKEEMHTRYTSSRAEQDASAMVSAFAHVISSSSTDDGGGAVIEADHPVVNLPGSRIIDKEEVGQPAEEQGSKPSLF